MVGETSKPMAASTSIMPVANIIGFFAGTACGNIIAMPSVNLKWPIAVNESIALMAIRPLKLRSALPKKAVMPKHIPNTEIRTINGFIMLYPQSLRGRKEFYIYNNCLFHFNFLQAGAFMLINYYQ